MAAISTYATSTPVVATDKWIGSDVNSATKNFVASDVSNYVYPRDVVNTTLTTYTFQLNTENKTLTYSGSGNSAFTIDTFANIAFTIGAEILVCNQTTDTITVAGAVGVTLWGSGTIGSGASARLKKTAINTWNIY